MWPLKKTLLLLLCCSGCWGNGCDTTMTYFESRNFHNVLHWSPVNIPGQDPRYSVEYNLYGESMRPMPGCQNISTTFCDLTSVMNNIHCRYSARIWVHEMCVGHYSYFMPLEKTVLGAPELSVHTSSSSFTLTITTPMGPHNLSIKEICPTIGQSPINYLMHLTHPESMAGRVFENTTGAIMLSHLQMDVEYCAEVRYQLTHPSTKQQSESAYFCVTLPGKPWLPVILLPALVAVFLLACLTLIPCQLYVTRKKHLPKVLTISKNDTPTLNPNLKEKMDVVSLYSEFLRTSDQLNLSFTADVSKTGEVNNEVSYAAQQCGDLPWHLFSYANQNLSPPENSDPSGDSATSYSMVVEISAPQNGEVYRVNGLGFSGSMSTSTEKFSDPLQIQTHDPNIVDSESNTEFPILPVSRDADGKLQFSGLLFQSGLLPNLDPVHSAENPSQAELAPTGERTPLLADLVTMDEPGNTDTAYGRVYFPNQISQSGMESSPGDSVPQVSLPDFPSSYRDNWVPGIVTDFQQLETNYRVRNEQV